MLLLNHTIDIYHGIIDSLSVLLEYQILSDFLIKFVNILFLNNKLIDSPSYFVFLYSIKG